MTAERAYFVFKPEPITLCRAEIRYAAGVGTKRKAMHRVAEAEGQKRPDSNQQRGGEETDPWHEIESACAEYAVAKYLLRFWPGDWWTHQRTADIPPDIEVRWTMYEQTGHLYLYNEDKEASRYVLVVGKMPTYIPVGWIYGREGMLQKFWGPIKDGRANAFKVPREVFHPIQDLRTIGRCQ